MDRDGRVVLADEVFTPDSSRYWPADTYKEGGAAQLRQAVCPQLAHGSRIRLGPPRFDTAPHLPASVVEATRERYIEAYERISGLKVADWIGA